MKSGMKFIVAFYLLFALVLNGPGCWQLFGPSDEEILKAINDSDFIKSGGFTVTAPVVILEKGKKDANGFLPVKVKLSLSIPMDNGEAKKIEPTPIFKMMKAKDTQGKSIWKASL